MKRYAVVIDRTETGFSAWVPDLPGCIAAASSFEETHQLIREAIQFHIESLRLHGDLIPEPPTGMEYVDTPIPA